jgi:ribosome-associated protein
MQQPDPSGDQQARSPLVYGEELSEEILRACRRHVRIRAIRSSGPGGQNVNKVSTTVQLHFDFQRCPALTTAVKSRLSRLGGNRVTARGVLIIQAEQHRSQLQNRKQALGELNDLLTRALRTPKRRLTTTPTSGSKEDRLQGKRRRGLLKRQRTASELD